jgi:hypothetical protein
VLEAAEAALGWLYDRRAHLPEELLDHREARHREAVREAGRRARGPGVLAGDGDAGLPRALGDRWETSPSFSNVIQEPSNGGNTPRKHYRRSMGSDIWLLHFRFT